MINQIAQLGLMEYRCHDTTYLQIVAPDNVIYTPPPIFDFTNAITNIMEHELSSPCAQTSAQFVCF